MKVILFVVSLLLAAPVLAGGDAVVMKTGTLADFDRATELVFDQQVTLANAQEMADRDLGQIVLLANPTDDEAVLLEFRRDEGKRRLGSFPQSVGNPLFMYFAESTIRDMANFAGGSPFYIRNRVKDAMVNRVTLREETRRFGEKEIPVTVAVMRPFENDPNRQRMRGFEDLTITAVMSDAVTGWYLSLDARAQMGEDTIYRRYLERTP